MRHNQWTIERDPSCQGYVAYHDAYDPTPVNPDDPMGDPDHVILGDTPEECKQLIDELEI